MRQYYYFVLVLSLATTNLVGGMETTRANFKSELTNSQGSTFPIPCGNLSYNYEYGSLIICYQGELLLSFHHFATFNKQSKVISLIPTSPHDQQNDIYNMSVKSGYIILPKNLSQLNDYMCDPLNRKGFVCSQCADGFGPSITLFGYKCVNCTDAWYYVPCFLLLAFAPITVLYLIVLVFKVSVTSAPMPCFIMCAQIAVLAVDYNRLDTSP